jgi:V8-like Glu-specific endopeptidase
VKNVFKAVIPALGAFALTVGITAAVVSAPGAEAAAQTATAAHPAAATAAAPAKATTYEFSEAQQQAALKYWTPARMRQAVKDSGDHVAPGPDMRPPPGGGGCAGASCVPGLVSGKLFYVAGHGEVSCTGTVVTSHGASSILTAGHCATQTGHVAVGHFLSVFVPNYESGYEPEGAWPVSGYVTPGGFENLLGQINPDLDYAVVHLGKNAAGQLIQNIVGSTPLKVETGWNYPVQLGGYPTNQSVSVLCNATTSEQLVSGHNPEFKYICPASYSDGVSGSALMYQGGEIGILGGTSQGGAPGGTYDFANRVSPAIVSFWNANTN